VYVPVRNFVYYENVVVVVVAEVVVVVVADDDVMHEKLDNYLVNFSLVNDFSVMIISSWNCVD